MSDNLRWFTKALYQMDHVVRLAPEGAWSQASPCEGWTARHVLGHVNAIQRFIEASINDAEAPMNPMENPDRHVGADPAADWAATRDAVLAALDRPGVLHKVVDTFRGKQEVDQFIGFNVADTTIHAWDLARALGVDDRLDAGLVERVTALVAPVADKMRNPMVFADAVAVAAKADPQTKLLGIVGRRA